MRKLRPSQLLVFTLGLSAPTVPAAAESTNADPAVVTYIGSETKAFVDSVINARDPKQNFASVEAIRFPTELGGLYFSMHENEDAFCRSDVLVTVWTKKRKVVFDNFPKAGLRSTYLEDRVFSEDAAGNVLESIDRPLDLLATSVGGLTKQIFDTTPLARPIDWLTRYLPGTHVEVNRYHPLVQMSFFGYALTNYVVFPNNLTDPKQVESVEMTRPSELKVTYRPGFVTHSRVQYYQFDPETSLLSHHYYRVSYVNDQLKAWHHTNRHTWANDIEFGAGRRIRLSAIGQPGYVNTLELIRAEIGDIEVLTESP